MARKQDEQLRSYGKQENQHVLAQIFSPNSHFYNDLKYIEETAERACRAAEGAFGRDDSIHVEALANRAMFYLLRLGVPDRAEAGLAQAVTILKETHGPDKLLIPSDFVVGGKPV